MTRNTVETGISERSRGLLLAWRGTAKWWPPPPMNAFALKGEEED
jgi:hypothetical protein